jgi:hypothetical protein
MRKPLAPKRPQASMLKLGAAAIGAFAGLSLSLASCGSDTTPPQGTYQGSSPDARNYCALAGACALFPDFGFGECMNQIARAEIELAPFGGDVGEKDRYACVKKAGTDCNAAKQCIGRISTNDKRCSDPALGDPFGNQPRSFCDDGSRITVCAQMGPGSESFSCADDFAKQHFGGPFCIKNADASALCGYKGCGDNVDAGAAPDDDAGAPLTTPTCDGNTLTYCTNGVEQRTSCSAFGGTCDTGAGKCSGTCQQKGFHCQGTELVEDCVAGAELPLYDCSVRKGWTCRVPQDTTTFGCAPPDSECAWGTFQAKCVDGVKIQFCDDGKLNLYDCRDIGAKSCEAGASGVSCKL